MPLPSAGGCRHSAAAGPACSPRQRQGRARTPPRVRVLERERRRGRHNVQLVSLKHGQVGPWRGGRHHAGAHAVRARGGRRIRYRSALARHTGVSAHGRKRGRHGAGWLHSTRCWRPRRHAPLRASRYIHTRVSRSLRRTSASSPCTCKGLCQMPNQDVKLKSVAVCWSAAAPRGRRQRGARAAGPGSYGPAPSSRRPGPRSRLPPAAAAACGRSASALAARRSARAQTLDPACILQPPRIAGLPGRAAAARPCSRFQAAGGQQPTWAHHRREDLCVPPHPAAGARYLARQPIMISRSTAARALVFAHAGACLFPPDPNRSRAAAAGSAPQARSQRAGTGAAPAGVTDLRTSDSAMAHRAAAASASVSRRLRQASARLQPIARRVSCTAP